MNPLEKRKRPQITLELLVKKGNQQWSSYGCYSPQEKQLAMDEAQKLDKDPNTLSVKLVKETYDPDDNSSSEITLFASSELTTNRWASGFEHRKPDQSDKKDGGAAKRATNTKKTNGKKTTSSSGGPGLFRSFFAILRGAFGFGAASPPAKPGTSASTDAEKKVVVKKVETVRIDEKVEPRLRNTLGIIMKFIASAVAVLDQNTLNMFNKFGICLYIGGRPTSFAARIGSRPRLPRRSFPPPCSRSACRMRGRRISPRSMKPICWRTPRTCRCFRLGAKR
jgi:hypothetical protein